MEKIKDYLILYKFRVWTLLIFTGMFSYLIALKAGYEFSLTKFLALFFAGTFSIMGNGALNEFLEVETDKIMDRTKRRPLVKGSISKEFALYSGIFLIVISLLISFLIINTMTAFFIILATFFYLVYTFLKKRTTLNVLIGGFAGNCTAWAGWSSATNSFNLFAFLLGMLIYFWTNPHIWAFAFRRREDYKKAEIKMLTAIDDERKAARYIVLSSIPLPIVSLILSYIASFSLIFIVISLILNGIFLAIAIAILINPSEKKAWILFKYSTPYLAMMFLLMFLDPSSLSFKI